MSQLKIRKYQQVDSAEVWKLHELGLAEIGVVPTWGQGWDKDLTDVENVYLKEGDFIVGQYKGQLVAMGAFKKIDEATAELKRMRVHPDFQRKGFGQQILDELEKRAREKGFKKMILDTSEKWYKAQNFYQKNGYQEVGRNNLGGRYNAIFYEKNL